LQEELTMAKSYRVVDVRENPQGHELGNISGTSPETAAATALGVPLTRSGLRSNLAAKVYWDDGSGVTNMIRLYQRKADALSEQGHSTS
jgi:hypothetical protein